MNKTSILPSKRRDSRAISFAEKKNIFSSLSKQPALPSTTQNNKTETLDLDNNDLNDRV